MQRRRFTKEYIIGMLKEQETGERTAEFRRRHGGNEGTFYKWRSRRRNA